MKKEYQQLLHNALVQCDAFSLMWREGINPKALELEQKLRPYLLGETLTDCWPGAPIPHIPAMLRTYEVNPDSIHILKCVDNVFDFTYPDYPEDLAFYQDGRLVFAAFASERHNWYE